MYFFVKLNYLHLKNSLQQHYQDLFPVKTPLSHEILAQASLGLLLLERKEQEKRAALSSGENIYVDVLYASHEMLRTFLAFSIVHCTSVGAGKVPGRWRWEVTLTSLVFIRKTDFAEKQGLLVCMRIHAYAVAYACIMLYIVYK